MIITVIVINMTLCDNYYTFLIAVESEGLKLSEAWFVESITIINDEGKKWHCTCNQWLSLHHTDCQVYIATYIK